MAESQYPAPSCQNKSLAARTMSFTGYWILFVLRALTVQDRGPVGAIRCHLKLERVGRRRQNLLAEAAFPGWFHVADPGPRVALHGSLGHNGCAHTVELIVGVLLFVRIIPQEGDPATVPHGSTLHLGMNDDKVAALHPLGVLGVAHFPARSHRTRFHVGVARPAPGEVVELLVVRSRLWHIHLRRSRSGEQQSSDDKGRCA